MGVVVGSGITIGPGITIGAPGQAPAVITFITTQNNEELLTQDNNNLITEN
jgi:hypothetical protein